MRAEGGLAGRREAMAATLAGLVGESRSAELRVCEGNAKKALVEIAVGEGVVGDLETYYKALDGALARYHKLKIGEINSAIKSLWANAYKGTDIEEIAIVSDEDPGAGGGEEEGGPSTSASASGARGSRSYNYRVVMRKGDTFLDMRGRCSAGQKVLASIVIRLA